MLRKLLRDQRGAYGAVEVMTIIGGVAVICGAIILALKGNGTTTGLTAGAGGVVEKVNNQIESSGL